MIIAVIATKSSCEVPGHSRLPLHHSVKVIASQYLHLTCQNTSLPDVLFGWSPFQIQNNTFFPHHETKSIALQKKKAFHFPHGNIHIFPHPSTSLPFSYIGYQPDRNPFTGTFWYSRPGDGCNSRSSKCHSLNQARVRRGGLGYTFHRFGKLL